MIAHASDEKGAERVSRLWQPRLACGLPKTVEQLIELFGREEVGHLMRDAIRCNQMQSDAIRCDQTLFGREEVGHLMRDAIRRNQTQSDAIRRSSGGKRLDT